eukprot:TRINITY_DN8876_c1_g1_i1.p1 TRINITY_DN8876_c1_g1~~TRINITY_DN8876_c1_g1_i1.p1  ORF type:complete len:464 (-),score=68.45 TRINITY_DN8876_c1_g1_i1:168-1559(-)
MAAPSLLAKLSAEFVGTFLLVLTVGCNVLGRTGAWSGISIASVLVVSVYGLGGISGANFNPAVSVTLGITKALGGPGLDLQTMVKYVLVQLTAGASAAVCYSVLFADSFRLGPAPGFDWRSAGLCELLYSFLLCFVVLHVAAADKNLRVPNQYYGVAISLAIVAGAYAGGPVSGGCFNPAIALGVDLVNKGWNFGWCAAYMTFELLGAILAAGCFWASRGEDFGRERATFPARLFSELLGSFMLVLTVGLNVLGKSPAAAMSIGAALACMIYALGDVSGAHFNPAVTVAVMASGREDGLTRSAAGCYIAAQIAGGVLGALMYTCIYGDSFPLGPLNGSSWLQAAIAEFMFTFLLCFVVLAVAVSRRTKTSQMFGLAIGACIITGVSAAGSISGASLNPAVSFGISTSHVIRSIESKFVVLTAAQFGKSIIYSLVEVAGGLAAAGAFSLTHEVDLASQEYKGFA